MAAVFYQMVDYFKQGGLPIMIAISVGSLWAFCLIVERWFFFSSTRKRHEELINVFFKTIEEQGPEAAVTILNDSSGVLTDIFRAGVENRSLSRDRLQEVINEIILGRLPEFEKYLSTIATLGGLMPILGLLGTVTGMIETFKQIVLYGRSCFTARAIPGQWRTAFPWLFIPRRQA
jgi:biopolymer transport protein ExbB